MVSRDQGVLGELLHEDADAETKVVMELPSRKTTAMPRTITCMRWDGKDESAYIIPVIECVKAGNCAEWEWAFPLGSEVEFDLLFEYRHQPLNLLLSLGDSVELSVNKMGLAQLFSDLSRRDFFPLQIDCVSVENKGTPFGWWGQLHSGTAVHSVKWLQASTVSQIGTEALYVPADVGFTPVNQCFFKADPPSEEAFAWLSVTQEKMLLGLNEYKSGGLYAFKYKMDAKATEIHPLIHYVFTRCDADVLCFCQLWKQYDAIQKGEQKEWKMDWAARVKVEKTRVVVEDKEVNVEEVIIQLPIIQTDELIMRIYEKLRAPDNVMNLDDLKMRLRVESGGGSNLMKSMAARHNVGTDAPFVNPMVRVGVQLRVRGLMMGVKWFDAFRETKKVGVE